MHLDTKTTFLLLPLDTISSVFFLSIDYKHTEQITLPSPKS